MIIICAMIKKQTNILIDFKSVGDEKKTRRIVDGI